MGEGGRSRRLSTEIRSNRCFHSCVNMGSGLQLSLSFVLVPASSVCQQEWRLLALHTGGEIAQDGSVGARTARAGKLGHVISRAVCT